MKLLCLNVGMFEANNPRLKDFLDGNNFDITCFQEVTRSVDNKASDEYVSYEIITRSLPNLDYLFFTPIWVLDRFYKSNFHGKEMFDFKLGGYVEFGNYIKTKYKISKGESIFLQNNLTYVTDWSRWPNEDYRNIQVVDLEIQEGKRLRVMNYHGIWSKDKVGNDKTYAACIEIINLATTVSYPVIICGDFNLFPNTDSIKLFDSNFVNVINKYDITTTRPETNELSNHSRNVVDYVFTSKDINIKNFKVIRSNVSDHLPLLLEFDLQ